MLWWEEGGCRLDRVGRVSHMNKDLKEVRKSAMELSGGRMSKTEGIAKTKALRQEHAQEVQGIARRPVWLEQRKAVDEAREVTREKAYCVDFGFYSGTSYGVRSQGVRKDDRRPMDRLKKASQVPILIIHVRELMMMMFQARIAVMGSGWILDIF